MKLLLFDWHGDGHHGIYMQRAVEALTGCCRLVAAGPDEVLARLSPETVELFPLGDARPEPSRWSQEHELAAHERALFDQAARTTGADFALHLYSDPVLEYFATAAPLPVPTAVTVFFPRWHYPWTYGTGLLPRDAVKALLLERAVRKWQSRRDALAVFSLDEAAVRRWNRPSGAPAFWFPEPPPAAIDGTESKGRRGCILYGALAPRKGVDRLATALADAATGLHVVLAGTVEVGYAEELDRLVGVMRAGGATVIVRAGAHTEIEGLRLLARARCAALPYHRHSGMSRVLLESANVETPVLVHDHGLVAALVRQHAIGVVLDCGESRAFREALRALCADGEVERYRPALRAFARRYEDAAFSRALRAPFGLRPQPAAALGEATR